MNTPNNSFTTSIFDSSTPVQTIDRNVPPRTGIIEKKMIKEKLEELGYPVKNLRLGDFDVIGEVTAKKSRSPDSQLYHTVGAFFRPNYERGLLLYALVKKYGIKSYLEIGFGRGYSTMCVAMAMAEQGGGKIITVDSKFDQEHLQNLTKMFPKEWFETISFVQMKSTDYYKTLSDDDKFDLIFIDGDHRYEAVRDDWAACKDRYTIALLFDDYHLPGKVEKDIECSSVIDQIEDPSKELIIMDRRVFLDDRCYTDEQIDYGQVLLMR